MDAPPFGGKPGEPVPKVGPDDVKAVWEVYQEVAKAHPGEQVAVGWEYIKHTCTPGADVSAVAYRTAMLRILAAHADEHLTPWIHNGELDGALFRAAAQTPMEWIGVGVERQGLPFDLEEFLRRAREATS